MKNSAVTWGDADWQERRATADWHKEPLSIYELHLGSTKSVVEDVIAPSVTRTSHRTSRLSPRDELHPC